MMSVVVCRFCCVFFKRKTANVMRISNWSSDVCSSDLNGRIHRLAASVADAGACGRCGRERRGRACFGRQPCDRHRRQRRWLGAYEFRPHHDDPGSIPGGNGGGLERRTRTAATGDRPAGRAYAPAPRRGPVAARGGGGAVAAVAKNEAEMSGHGFAGALRERVTVERRSEEHTSELQSLMRISYAVFCLKKKKKNRNIRITTK